MTLQILWLVAVLGMPASVGLASMGGMRAPRLRGLATWAATGMLACSLLTLVVPELAAWQLELSVDRAMLLEGHLLRVDRLSSVLPALAAALWLFTVVVSPRTRLGVGGLGRTAWATLFTTTAFLTEVPLLLLAAWAASVLTLTTGLADSRAAAPRRNYAPLYLHGSTVLLGIGMVLAFGDGRAGTSIEFGGLALIVAAALIRKGILPFHAWLPAIFEHGRLGPPTLFCAPQLGTYVVAVLVRPRAPDELLRVVAVLALATSVYAAAVALVQRSARRACAYLFMSQSALVLAGLDSSSHDALAGALVLWLSASLAFAGLARSLLVLEARRGPLDLSKYHGGYERKPLLGSTFLVIGLSCAGFPGTLGFVGEELLLGGAVNEFPLLGFLVIVSAALTGLAIMRMYFSLFCGVSPATVRLGLRPKEAVGFAAMALVLVASGLAPKWVVSSRIAASAEMLTQLTSARRPYSTFNQ